MPKLLPMSYAAGLFSGALFLTVYSMGLGFIFMFLPTLPLFFLGLSNRPYDMPMALIMAAIVIAVPTGLPVALFFLLFWGLPCWYMVQQSARHRLSPALKQLQWFPIGCLLTSLALYGCSLLGLAMAYYAEGNVSLPQALSENIHTAFSDMDDDYGNVITLIANRLSFLIFPVTIWLWGSLLYGHAWLAHTALVRRNRATRPDFAVQIFIIPSWLLGLLGIAGLASLIGSASMQFYGKACLLSLLLPYFFLGAALMHRASASWPIRNFALMLVYVLIVTLFWPAMVLAGLGLWHQIRHLRNLPPP